MPTKVEVKTRKQYFVICNECVTERRMNLVSRNTRACFINEINRVGWLGFNKKEYGFICPDCISGGRITALTKITDVMCRELELFFPSYEIKVGSVAVANTLDEEILRDFLNWEASDCEEEVM